MSGSFRNLQNLKRVNVTLPTDENGLLGRECPAEACLGYFKVKSGTGLKGTDLDCHCPYCGHTASQDHFYTEDQLKYARSVAIQQVQQALRADLKTFEFDHPAKGSFGIGISLTLKDSPRWPLHRYRENRLETHVTCSGCTLEYAVYGVFAFCPDCGVHNSLQILDRNLDLVRRQLVLASSLADDDMRIHLIEDALENCVSAFDGFGRESCRVRARASRAPDKVNAISFQNLQTASERLRSLFDVDFKGAVDTQLWRRSRLAFMRRHLIAHRSGVVDDKYVSETQDHTFALGRRLRIDPADILALTSDVQNLGEQLLSVLPAPLALNGPNDR